MNRDDYAGAYGLVCDVVERNYHDWPLEDDTGMLHTSDEARAAASRIFEILGIEVDFASDTTVGFCSLCHASGLADDTHLVTVGTDPVSGRPLCQKCWTIVSVMGDTMDERQRRLVGIAKYRLKWAADSHDSDEAVATYRTIVRNLGEGEDDAPGE